MASTYDKITGESKPRGLGEQASRVMEDIRELGTSAAVSAGEVTKELREQGAEALRVSKERATQMKDGLETSLSDNPWKSVLIAAGIGALIGFALHRSR